MFLITHETNNKKNKKKTTWFFSGYVTRPRHEQVNRWRWGGGGVGGVGGVVERWGKDLWNIFAVEEFFFLLEVAGERGIGPLPLEETAFPEDEDEED